MTKALNPKIKAKEDKRLNKLALENASIVVLDPEVLRKTAKAARLSIKYGGDGKVPPLDKEILQDSISVMEQDIQDEAEAGNLSSVWSFGETNMLIEHMYEVAAEFKRRHSKFLLVVDEGKKEIVISWKPCRY